MTRKGRIRELKQEQAERDEREEREQGKRRPMFVTIDPKDLKTGEPTWDL